MNARILPREEWDKLDSIQIPQIGPTIPPGDAEIAVVESDGKIVATMSVIRVTHFESLWIDPEHRGNPSLAGKLIREGVEAAKRFGSTWAWGASDSDGMDSIIERVGGKLLKIRSFIIPIGEN